MAALGMGVVYEKTHDRQSLRHPTCAQIRQALLDQYYYPQHRRLTEVVDQALARCGQCMIVDCHSFPALPLPYEADQDPDRPDVCIGTDPFHTPERLAAAAVDAFAKAGFSTALNRPFGGAIVPAKHMGRNPAVASIMIEVNRRLYMDETTGRPLPEFETVRHRLSDGLIAIAAAASERRVV